MSTCDRQRKQKKTTNKQTKNTKKKQKTTTPHQYGRRNLSY